MIERFARWMLILSLPLASVTAFESMASAPESRLMEPQGPGANFRPAPKRLRPRAVYLMHAGDKDRFLLTDERGAIGEPRRWLAAGTVVSGLRLGGTGGRYLLTEKGRWEKTELVEAFLTLKDGEDSVSIYLPREPSSYPR